MQIIVFTGGLAPAPSEAAPFFENILKDREKPGAAIAADSGLETLRAYQKYFAAKYDFAPSHILGDFDSISDKKILDEYDSAIVERSPSYKDDTDTELALKLARKLAQGQKTEGRRQSIFFGSSKNAFITLIGGAGGRADHFLAIYDLFGTKLSPDAWLCGEQVLWKAERCEFMIEGLKAGDVISIARAANKNRGGKIISRGLEWESTLFRKKGMPSVSNTISEEWAREKKPIQINFERGSFALILPLFASVRLGKDSTER